MITPWNVAGYVASGLVIATFCMKDIVPLRLAAIVSNIAFFAYGIGLGLVPVWLLHAVLLPINIMRLRQSLRSRCPSRLVRRTPVHFRSGHPVQILGATDLAGDMARRSSHFSQTWRARV
jgi:hypothetical protein